MRVILGGLAIDGLIDRFFQGLVGRRVEDIYISKAAIGGESGANFAAGQLFEFDLASDYVAQSILEGLGAVEAGGGAIGKNFLQSRRPVADATEEEMIQPQELKPDVPPHCLPGASHGVGELHHVL